MSTLAATATDVEPVHTSRESRTPDRLDVKVASTVDEVIEAWRLVYQSYRRIDIIDENPIGLHTNIHTLHPDTSVIVGNLNGEPVSTLTVMHDSVHGLPLDSVYSRQLNMLRRLGRPIVEAGLFADRREKSGRALAAIMEMMRYVFWNAAFEGADLLCGVHPHHANFYIKTFGFDVIGPITTYPTVRDHLVVLLRLDIEHQLKLSPLPRGLHQYCRTQAQLPGDAFKPRYNLSPRSVMGTPIAAYLHGRGLLDRQGLVTSPVPAYIWRQLDQQALVA